MGSRLKKIFFQLTVVTLLTLGLLAGAPQVQAAEAVGPDQISQAIELASGWLIRQQRPDGTWLYGGQGNESTTGATALVVLALANAGVEADDPAMQRALTWLRQQEPTTTYSLSLQTQALAMVSPQADLPILLRNASMLEKSQTQEGRFAGAWSYGDRGAGDNSNSQFAILGLHEAERAGVRINPEVWKRAAEYWARCQRMDGSWSYTAGGGGGTGSMTCAGIASIWITAEHTGRPDARVAQNGISCCGGGSSPKPLEAGISWLGKNFSVTQNPATGSQQWLYYYLYGLERVGRFTARRFIGTHDWYLEGAKMFLESQDKLSGSFRSRGSEGPVVATSFALLFLAKGRRPVVIAKSQHGPRNDWNQHGHDIAHLVDFIEGRWRADYPAGLSWHVLDTQSATTDDLVQAPVLWLGGREGLDLGRDPGRRLRQYIDQGGFIFAESACPNSEDFDQEFRQLVSEIFPEPEYQLNLLPPEHPAWHAEQLVDPQFQRPLLGIDYGCRTCLIYAPPTGQNDAPALPSLSCLWELGGPNRSQLPAAAAAQVDAALAIGANVIAYATNRELKNKDELFTAAQDDALTTNRGERGQLTIGKLRHGGLCDAAPNALTKILRAATRELGIRVDDSPEKLDLIDSRIFRHHMLFMHGRQAFAFDEAQQANLRTFLERGGTLLADSVCAAGGFTDAFRHEMGQAIPDYPLESIPPDDPLFAAGELGGYDIRLVTLREPSQGDGPLATRQRQIPPRLEGIRINDRWAVIFSPYDISCALEKQNSMECTGYDRDDAEKIALNVLLYSLNR